MREPKEYTDQLTKQVEGAKTEAGEAEKSLALIKSIKITSPAFFEEVAGIVRQASGKLKFLDDERKISVMPLNHEVDRINAWYKPALEALKKIVEQGKSLMSAYTLEQQRKERLLLEQAQAEAQKALAAQAEAQRLAAEAQKAVTDGAVAGAAEAGVVAQTAMVAASDAATKFVEAAGATAPPKVAGVSAPKPAWKYTITDPQALVKAHPDLSMPDEKKVKAWVAEHGDKNVPTGVKVEADVKFTVRS